MENIEYLYHYTSIETLALILKNRSIRFQSLDKMDDLQEQLVSDIKNIGQFCFVSSWTDNAEESIPMWNMYASLHLGVRIKMRRNPFKLYKNTAEEISKVFNISYNDESKDMSKIAFESYIPFSEMIDKDFFSAQSMQDDLLHEIKYTDDKSKLYPVLLKDDGCCFSISLNSLGRYKNLHWKFQREWRYILNFIPFHFNQTQSQTMLDFKSIINKMKLGLENQPFPYYDMALSDEAFCDMEVTMSPRISSGSKIIVQDLIEKYNPSAKYHESSLVGLI